MNLAEKYPYWQTHTNSITRHDDESSAVRKAMINKMREYLDEEEAAMDARDQERLDAINAQLNNPPDRSEPPEGYVPPTPPEESPE